MTRIPFYSDYQKISLFITLFILKQLPIKIRHYPNPGLILSLIFPSLSPHPTQFYLIRIH